MQRVKAQLAQSAPGSLFGYANFVQEPDQSAAVAAALSRLCKAGEIIRFAKGQYYRPHLSRFGLVPPSDQAVLAVVGAATGQLVPYATGIIVYNCLRLTTQVPAVVTLASTRRLRNLPRRLRTVIRPALERVSDVPLLQWLEVLRDVRRIPDTSPDRVVTRVAKELRLLAPADRRRLTELACQQTPPRGRALLGALLENLPNKKGAAALRQTLNPLTTYRIGVSAKVLPNRAAWRIQ
ncbi:MAG: DUF6088 family protein [Janthinobacterium lividum]